ncbi:MAG: hypothetical protein HQK53_14325 [Oligoflexia bacterium]|nr:hypothetical protein [Oligoflexia bacterium]
MKTLIDMLSLGVFLLTLITSYLPVIGIASSDKKLCAEYRGMVDLLDNITINQAFPRDLSNIVTEYAVHPKFGSVAFVTADGLMWGPTESMKMNFRDAYDYCLNTYNNPALAEETRSILEKRQAVLLPIRTRINWGVSLAELREAVKELPIPAGACYLPEREDFEDLRVEPKYQKSRSRGGVWDHWFWSSSVTDLGYGFEFVATFSLTTDAYVSSDYLNHTKSVRCVCGS